MAVPAPKKAALCRGFVEGSDDLMFCTHARSAKVHELGVRPTSELCWYFTETREQFRLSGTMCVVDKHRRHVGDGPYAEVRP